jgi:hypothetical protein
MVRKLTVVRAIEPFLSRPGEKLHLAEISRIIDEAHPTVRQWLNDLVKEGVLLREQKGRLTLYCLNLSDYIILNYIVIAEKERLTRKCESSLLLKELTKSLNQNLEEKILCIIFGSAALDFESAEDIDLLVIGKTDEKSIKRLSSRLNKELHIINVSSLSKISKALKEEIIKKHLIIKGSEAVVRWIIWQA